MLRGSTRSHFWVQRCSYVGSSQIPRVKYHESPCYRTIISCHGINARNLVQARRLSQRTRGEERQNADRARVPVPATRGQPPVTHRLHGEADDGSLRAVPSVPAVEDEQDESDRGSASLRCNVHALPVRGNRRWREKLPGGRRRAASILRPRLPPGVDVRQVVRRVAAAACLTRVWL
jgi:hypothetical protein